MKSQKTVLMAIVCVLSGITLGGCSSASLAKQADVNDRAAQIADDSAVNLQGILDKYPAGTIEDGQLVDLIMGVLPASQKAKFQSMVAIGGDVRASAVVLATDLPGLATTLRAEAVSLRADAASGDTQWNNGLASITSLAKSFGGAIGIIGGIAGVWFKRGKDRAITATTDIVTSIEAAKAASPDLATAFSNGAGAAMRSSMSPATMKVVRSIRDAH